MTRISRRKIPAVFACIVLGFASVAAQADEGGVSFWLPGQFGSLAAAPGTPGWTIGAIYYHSSVDAGGSKQFNNGGQVRAGLDAKADLGFVSMTYIFAQPFLGAQASLGVGAGYGRMNAHVDATLVGPGGGILSGSANDARTGFSDLYPLGSLKWNFGVHNFMVYSMWDFPIGTYNSDRLANIGIGHWAADAGAGYTYFNPKTGLEFSVVTGFTYNWENPSTDYKNGIDWHVDWGVSQFLSKQWHIGLVGYFYQQFTGDSGPGATLGDFKSRVAGIGPQIGYIFPINETTQGYVNLKGYKEFAAENRAEGWNVWLTFAMSPLAPQPAH